MLSLFFLKGTYCNSDISCGLVDAEAIIAIGLPLLLLQLRRRSPHLDLHVAAAAAALVALFGPLEQILDMLAEMTVIVTVGMSRCDVGIVFTVGTVTSPGALLLLWLLVLTSLRLGIMKHWLHFKFLSALIII